MDSIIYLLTDLFNLPPVFGLECDGPSRFEGRYPKRKYIVGWLTLMVMFANHLTAVRIVFVNRSVISAIVLKGVSFGSVGRGMMNIIFFVMTPGVLIASAVIVRRFPISVAPVRFSADMLISDLFMEPAFFAIRPGCGGK